ncbi:MAG: group III truncated hemoglobin [Bacteroidetes bacterium]|jgi:hemoglobin|nr:group III truncated hemoglobin [Bacteroidota bacterium]MDF1866539.1 group III truncated hemoglobin [Saprospiraceae bacterium]
MKTDIRHRTDIEQLIEQFYQKLLDDPIMRPIFVDVAKIDLAHHLPIICDFWESILFYSANYRGNAMLPHIKLSQQYPLKEIHFELWLRFLFETLDELFEGEKAELVKTRAQSIGDLMRFKVGLMGL